MTSITDKGRSRCCTGSAFKLAYEWVFPVLKCLIGVLAIILGAVILNHGILDCEELQQACADYRAEEWPDCPEDPWGADCDCRRSVTECYSTEISSNDELRCVPCDEVSDEFSTFVKDTGTIIVVVGILTLCLAALTKYVGKNMNGVTLTFVMFVDIGLFLGVAFATHRKVSIANAVGTVCSSSEYGEAMDYAPETMGNLCEYRTLVSIVAVFWVLYCIIAAVNILYSGYGIIHKVGDEFEEFRDTRSNSIKSVGAKAPEQKPAESDLPTVQKRTSDPEPTVVGAGFGTEEPEELELTIGDDLNAEDPPVAEEEDEEAIRQLAKRKMEAEVELGA